MVSHAGEVLYLDPEGVLRAGYLKKAGLIHKAFRTRFFRLVQKPLHMFYYLNNKVKTPRGRIALIDTNGVAAPVTRDKTEIRIETKGRTFVLRAAGEDDAKTWVKAISSAFAKDAERRARTDGNAAQTRRGSSSTEALDGKNQGTIDDGTILID